MVEVVQAQSRQVAHEQARLWAGLVEISHTVAVDDLPGQSAAADAVERSLEHSEWAAGEIAAALVWTRTAAEREFRTAVDLVEGLPLVFAALHAGVIDRPKAQVFLRHLEPGIGDLTDQQIHTLCTKYVPLAPGLTTKQLSDRLRRAIIALDPEYHRRRYQQALGRRGVVCYLDPRTGTATITGQDLPAEQAAAAVARVDRLAEAIKRAGHPGPLQAIAADVFLGLLGGDFHGRTEAQIIADLAGRSGPDEEPQPARTPEPAAWPVPEHTSDTEVYSEQHTEAKPEYQPEPGTDDEPEPAPDPEWDREPETTPVPEPGAARWDREPVATREGIEIRLGLTTAAALDHRPGEIAGLGPVDAEVARTTVTQQHWGAEWRFALVDHDGYLLLAGHLRRRPRDTDSGRVRGGIVELHITLDELRHYSTDRSVLGNWAGILAEISNRWRDRHALRRALGARPDARFVRGALARHVEVRDRTCCGPGCTRTARRSDMDHTREVRRRGRTEPGNNGPACRTYHHPDRDRGWSLTQPEPGHFHWRSPLGRTYRTRGEPIRHDLPEPQPRPTSGSEIDMSWRPPDRPILWRPANDPPRPPPTRPEQPDDEEPPF